MKQVILLEPVYTYGLGYLRAAKAMGMRNTVVVPRGSQVRHSGISEFVDSVIEGDLHEPDALERTLREAGLHDGPVLAGNEFVLGTASEMSRRFGWKGPGDVKAAAGVNKLRAYQIFDSSSLSTIRFAAISSAGDLCTAASSVGFPAVFKPVDLWGSIGVKVVNDLDELTAAFQEAKNAETSLSYRGQGKFLFEEFVDGPELTVDILMWEGTAEGAFVTSKTVSPLPYRVELAHVFPANLSVSDRASAEHIAVAALLDLGLHYGAFHVEVIAGRDGPTIVEVNPRASGDFISTHLIPLVTGTDPYHWHLQRLFGLPVHHSPEVKRAAGIVFLAPCRAGTVTSVRLPPENPLGSVEEFCLSKTLPHQTRGLLDNGDRIGRVSEMLPTDPVTGRRISSLTASALCMKPSATLNTHQAQVMHILKQRVYGFAEAHHLVLGFQTMLRCGHLHHLSQWIVAAAKSEVYALQRFAKALKRDGDALRNAIVEPWSSGQINRLKTIKRSTYGRGGIGLLRARLLPLSEFSKHQI